MEKKKKKDYEDYEAARELIKNTKPRPSSQ